MKKKTKRILTGVGITSILVVCVISAVIFWPKSGASVDPNAGVFDIVVMDGSRGVELDLSDVRANLYLLPDDATDLTGGDWSEFENQTAIDSMNEIDESDLQLDDGYVMAVVIYQVISTDIDGSTLQEDQNCQYYAREARIYAGALNSLVLYETLETGAQLTCYNANTGAVINTAATNITSIPCVNFTMAIMATNQSAFNHHQIYTSYWSYVNDDWADLSLTLNFNGTVKKNELVVTGGMSIDGPVGTTISYHWTYLDTLNIQTYTFNWHVNVTGSYPTSWEVVVDNAGLTGVAPVLAYNGVAI
jgi:hypothetical protein